MSWKSSGSEEKSMPIGEEKKQEGPAADLQGWKLNDGFMEGVVVGGLLVFVWLKLIRH